MKRSLVIGFLVILYGIFFVNIFAEDKLFSENENRKLSQKPEFTMEKLLNGEFRDGFEKYITDQYVFRDSFVGLKSICESIIGKKENNDVYIAKDDFLVQKMKDYDKSLLERNASYINELAEMYNVTVAIAPTAYTVYSENLPSFVDRELENDFINEFYDKLIDVNTIDLVKVLRDKKDESLYYKTDHHWTTLGAYYAYEEIAKSLGLNPYSIDEFEREVITDEFYGTLFSKGNFFYKKPDTMELFNYDLDVEVNYIFEDKITDTFYEEEALDKKDKYEIFFGGNHPIIEITNKDESSLGGKVAIIKDSYANSLVPFLSRNFEEVHVIDLRYFNGSTSEYLKENNIEDIIVLYNANGLSTDNNIYKLKFAK